jgi:hypothetical protein
MLLGNKPKKGTRSKGFGFSRQAVNRRSHFDCTSQAGRIVWVTTCPADGPIRKRPERPHSVSINTLVPRLGDQGRHSHSRKHWGTSANARAVTIPRPMRALNVPLPYNRQEHAQTKKGTSQALRQMVHSSVPNTLCNSQKPKGNPPPLGSTLLQPSLSLAKSTFSAQKALMVPQGAGAKSERNRVGQHSARDWKTMTMTLHHPQATRSHCQHQHCRGRAKHEMG